MYERSLNLPIKDPEQKMDPRPHEDWTPFQFKNTTRVAQARMTVVAAEVSAAISTKVDGQMAHAGRIASDLRDLAQHADEAREAFQAISQNRSTVAILFQGLQALRTNMEKARPIIESFLEEHGIHVDDFTKERVISFFGWIEEAHDEVRKGCQARAKEISDDLTAASSETADHLLSWRAADRDGLSPE